MTEERRPQHGDTVSVGPFRVEAESRSGQEVLVSIDAPFGYNDKRQLWVPIEFCRIDAESDVEEEHVSEE